jgi:hypothetical protein
MPNNLGLGWVIAELQRERIGFAVDHDCFPPAFFGGRLRVCPKTSGGITKFSEHEAD